MVLQRVLATLIGSDGGDGTLIDDLGLLWDVVGHDGCLCVLNLRRYQKGSGGLIQRRKALFEVGILN